MIRTISHSVCPFWYFGYQSGFVVSFVLFYNFLDTHYRDFERDKMALKYLELGFSPPMNLLHDEIIDGKVYNRGHHFGLSCPIA